MIYICAWCNTELRRDDRAPEGGSPDDISHGVCSACAERVYGEAVESAERRGNQEDSE